MAGCACFARDDVRQVFLAASDSRPAAKATADYVCTDPAKRKWVDALGNECP